MIPGAADILRTRWADGASIGEIALALGPDVSRAHVLKLAQDIGLIGKPAPKPSRQELFALKRKLPVVSLPQPPQAPQQPKVARVYIPEPPTPAKRADKPEPSPELPPLLTRKPVVIVDHQPGPIAPNPVERVESNVPAIIPDFVDTGSNYPILRLRLGDCKWPIGDVGSASFDFCRQPAEIDKPYCPAHCKEAYAPTPGHMRRRAA